MKYEVGQKVRIKTWEQMKKEYGSLSCNILTTNFFYFTRDMEKVASINNRVVTIKESRSSCYIMVESNKEYYWTDAMIERSYTNTKKKKCKLLRIKSRFEILDL